MPEYQFHPSGHRGHADHGWLNAHHSFSFAGWYDPTRIHFGMLRVLNDDTVQPGMGFGMHPHDNMEIITIPLSGALEHKDSMGNGTVIKAGEVQLMSAGTGVFHSEFNPSSSEPVSLFQIWIFPKIKNVKPRYAQAAFDPRERKNRFQLLVKPGPADQGLWIHQDAFLSLGRFDKGQSANYAVNRKGNGVYAMVVNGKFIVEGYSLSLRDALGISNTDHISIQSGLPDSELLLIEVPMN